MEFSDPSSTTEFNGMISVIYRLDAIHKFVHKVKAMKDEDQYFQGLHSLFMELVRHITKGKNRGTNSEELMENPIIQKHLNISDKCLTDIFTIQQLKKKGKPIPYTCWKNLYIWHMELVALEQKSGLGLSYGKDPRFAMGN